MGVDRDPAKTREMQRAERLKAERREREARRRLRLRKASKQMRKAVNPAWGR